VGGNNGDAGADSGEGEDEGEDEGGGGSDPTGTTRVVGRRPAAATPPVLVMTSVLVGVPGTAGSYGLG
jgi:hypothetical protein